MPKDDPEQLTLIETKHPLAKKFRTARSAYNTFRQAQAEAKEKADGKREEILGIVREMGVKPDVDGVIAFEMDGQIVKIVPGKSVLKISDVNADAKDDAPDEFAGD
jgi:hypothetical protein